MVPVSPVSAGPPLGSEMSQSENVIGIEPLTSIRSPERRAVR